MLTKKSAKLDYMHMQDNFLFLATLPQVSLARNKRSFSSVLMSTLSPLPSAESRINFTTKPTHMLRAQFDLEINAMRAATFHSDIEASMSLIISSLIHPN